MIEGFESHAAGHAAVPDNRNGAVGAAFEAVADSQPQSGRNRGGGMPGAISVVLAFDPFGKAADTVELPQRVKLGAIGR